jgi:glycosyltransferase involved in cell wall biosynthesis
MKMSSQVTFESPVPPNRAARELPSQLGLTSAAAATNVASSKVSIIIPAYNIAPYIAETLDSVFAQTFTDYEVIVVNDGSPDTEEFERAMQPYLDRVIYLKQENGGASVARNAGLQTARGEFVAFLDGDDLWLPNYLEEQMKVHANARLRPGLRGRDLLWRFTQSGSVLHDRLDGRCPRSW